MLFHHHAVFLRLKSARISRMCYIFFFYIFRCRLKCFHFLDLISFLITFFVFSSTFLPFTSGFFLPSSSIFSVHSILTIWALSPTLLGSEIILVNPEFFAEKALATFWNQISDASLALSKLLITFLLAAILPSFAKVTIFSTLPAIAFAFARVVTIFPLIIRPWVKEANNASLAGRLRESFLPNTRLLMVYLIARNSTPFVPSAAAIILRG